MSTTSPNTKTSKPSASPAAQGPPSPVAVTALKIAVVAMGIMIIVGIAVVIGRVIYLASGSANDTPQPPPAATLKPRQTLALPAIAQISQTSLHGDRLLVRYQNGSQTELAIYDLRNGRLLSTIVVTGAGNPNTTPSPSPQQ